MLTAEVVSTPEDMARGLMGRDSLAPDRAMLFVHRTNGLHNYWMYRVKFPIDIIWMDASGRVVEIVENAQPCNPARLCQNYGGHHPAQFVLELNAGGSRRFGLHVGQQLHLTSLEATAA